MTDRTDRDASIADVVATMLHAVDDLDWDTIRSCCAAAVATDYTSLWGGEPEQQPIDQLLGTWQALLPGFDTTQHLLGPIVVTGTGGDTATCDTNVRGYHVIVSDGQLEAVWMCAGRYRIRLSRGDDGWKVAAITLLVAYEEGERRLTEVAQDRVKAGRGGRTGG